MDKERMCDLLPEMPPEGMLEWAIEKFGKSELGGEFCIFNSERVPIEPSIQEVMEYNSLAPRRTEWAASCTCTACGEDFITQKEPGMSAIRTVNGEDGWTYTISPGEPVNPYMGIEIQREGDHFLCPLCGSEVELIHKRKLTGGRTKQIMVLTVQNVEGYTAIFYWLVWRTINEYGFSECGATPEEAYVLTETGSIVRFTKVKRMGAYYGANRVMLKNWQAMTSNADVIDKPYPDWRSINSKKAGADIWPVYPDLEGKTGEKTALVEYLKSDGWWPVEYLKWWRKRRSIENLCRQGQAKLVAEIVREAWRYSGDTDSEGKKYLDLSKRKPHEMLNVSKAEFRYMRQQGITWTPEAARIWNKYRKAGGQLNLIDYLTFAQAARTSGVNAAIDILGTYGHDFDKVARYLNKKGQRLSEAGILLDTRNAARQIYGRELTEEELWPRNLHEAHDRMTRMQRELKCQAAAAKLNEGFARILETYGHLQWTDGDLEMILPKNNGELVYEGDVLRHCVGGYAAQHTGGSSVIFFVRRHRRPDRPYYTLSIDMRGKPRECQLHGYGNERHGEHKQYTHSIHKKVRAFCDRWEREILLQWYAQEQQKKNKEAKTE